MKHWLLNTPEIILLVAIAFMTVAIAVCIGVGNKMYNEFYLTYENNEEILFIEQGDYENGKYYVEQK